MISLTKKERGALLVLFKDYKGQHNSSSIGRLTGISRVGALKMLKRMENQELLKSEKIGNSIIYKPSLEEDYPRQLMSFVLSDEANSFKRWKEEFKGLFKKGRIVILFGSAVRNYSKANDIDVLAIIEKEDYKDVQDAIDERQQILPKKIHSLIMTKKDLIGNLKENQGAMREIVKTGVVLYGQETYVEAIRSVSSV